MSILSVGGLTTVAIAIADPDWARIVAALSVRYGYTAILDGDTGKANPQTPEEFVRLRIGQWAVEETLQHEASTARAAIIATPLSVS